MIFKKKIVFIVTVNFSFIISALGNVDNCKFCRHSNIGVFFSPYVSAEDVGVLNRYSVPNLLPMVSKIQSEFNKVVIKLIPNQNISQNLLPNAIATWNENASQYPSARMVEAMILSTVPFNTSNGLYFKETMENANRIYANTTKTFLQLCQASKLNSSSIFREHVTQIRETFPREDYKIGVVFNASAFQLELIKQPKQFVRHIKKDFDLVDFVYFAIDNDEIPSDTPFESIFEAKLTTLKDVIQVVKQNRDESSTKLHFGVIGAWSDTTKKGEIDYSQLVKFWEEIVKFGESENLTVILREAFDNPIGLDPRRNSYGWWRLIENGLYTESSQFVFEDKETVAHKEKLKNSEWFISQIEQDVQFNSENMIVHFAPYPSYLRGSTSVASITSIVSIFLRQIAKKFRTVFFHQRLDFPLVAKELMPELVAKHNLDYPLAPLQLIIHFDMRLGTPTDVMVEKILKANEMSPNTINQVIIHPINSSDLRLGIFIKEMLNRNGSKTKINVGCQLSIDECAGFKNKVVGVLEPEISKIKLGWSDFVYFVYLPNWPVIRGYKSGVDRVLSQAITRFEHCKRRMAKVFPEKYVGFETGYSHPLDSGNSNYSSLAIFWKGINAWAGKANTRIIMYEAFDSRDKNADRTNAYGMGWWRVRNQNFGEDFLFEEKRLVALENLRESLSKSETSTNWSWTWIVIIILLLASVPFFLVYFLIRKYQQRKENLGANTITASFLNTCNDETIALILQDTDFIKDNCVVVGSGNFGTVYKCFMPIFQSVVAVKTVSCNVVGDNENFIFARKNLLSEIKIMSGLGQHENVLQMLGVCLEKNLFLVTEFCKHGSLLSYLRSNFLENTIPSYYELLQFCTEIASGMQFLGENNVIHGDLSARNVLLNENKICKISDFGLSRKLEQYEKYMKKGEEPLPWRWMAIESLTRLEFSTKSDIWSMGVTFWEVFTLGKIPYPEMTYDRSFCEKLEKGLRLEKPDFAPDILYKMMLLCWETESQNRPTADELARQLRELKTREYINA